MKRYATLLIKNIERIYTMEECMQHPVVLRHGFIAMHHEDILAIGCDGEEAYVDKDTRILDGRGHIAVPGFIDVQARLPWDGRDLALKQLEILMAYMRHGTLSIALKQRKDSLFHQPYVSLYSSVRSTYPIVDAKRILQDSTLAKRKRFCISAYSEDATLYHQLLCARIMKLRCSTPSLTLLQALTRNPARALQDPRIGVLRRQHQGDVLLFACRDLDELFTTWENMEPTTVIKKGVRIVPDVLI